MSSDANFVKLPPLSSVLASSSDPSSPLATALSILFESSQILCTHVAPELYQKLMDSNHAQSAITSYDELVDAALAIIQALPDSVRAQFVNSHPRIGETKNLSPLSSAEQQNASHPTPPEILQRLEHLNACYEAQYPGLRYITFVNGRSRAEIVVGMEGVLEVNRGESKAAESLKVFQENSKEWRRELDRAVVDVGRIAKSRLAAMNTKSYV